MDALNLLSIDEAKDWVGFGSYETKAVMRSRKLVCDDVITYQMAACITLILGTIGSTIICPCFLNFGEDNS